MTTKNAPSVDDYLALNWAPRVDPCDDGGYRLTVPPLRDLELFADAPQELWGQWRDALRSHLMAYMAAGKVIPTPRPLWGDMIAIGGAGITEEAEKQQAWDTAAAG